MNFASDNVYGVHPRILAALADANEGTAASYGSDEYTRQAEEALSAVFETDVRAFLVTNGTAANGLALSALTPGHGAVLCHREAHISCDECNSPEFFTGGAKILGLEGDPTKLTPAAIETVLGGFIRGEHDPKPKAVSITNATELGTVYTPGEIRAIAQVVRSKGLKLHMDGARFANAVASLGVTPAEASWKSGIDVMSFGATKNGAMMLEAVVFFSRALADEFGYRRMRGGQLLSKGRYLGAQMLAYLAGGLWLDNARCANALAKRFAEGIGQIKSARLAHPVEANEVFVIMPRQVYDGLRAAGAMFHDWMPDSLGDRIGPSEILSRFVFSFATPERSIDQFLALAARLDKN
jgi:threonine aldolase